MVVMTALMGAIGSAMMLAGRAVPDRSSSLGAAAEARQVVALLAVDLITAQTLSACKPEEIVFNVATRNADTTPETIRYSWSQTPGAALTREYNGGSPSEAAAHVYEFQLQYETKTVDSKLYVTCVRIKLRTSADSFTRVETSVRLMNEPEAPVGMEVEPW